MRRETEAGRAHISVCADDYGLNAAVDEAALALAAQGRISAIGCMTRMPQWKLAAPALQDVAAQTDVGLHLDLTQAPGTGIRYRLGALIAMAHVGMLRMAPLRSEIRAQLDAFEDALGGPPDFVDGHQHVHQLPGVRDALLEELMHRYAFQRPWLRNTQPPRQRSAACRMFSADARKHRLIAQLGAGKFLDLALVCGFRTNRHLLGVYGFDGSLSGYEARLACWCNEAGADDLLMCHPASAALSSDPIGKARITEYAVLRSSRFGELLDEFRLHIARLARLPVSPPGAASQHLPQR